MTHHGTHCVSHPALIPLSCGSRERRYDSSRASLIKALVTPTSLLTSRLVQLGLLLDSGVRLGLVDLCLLHNDPASPKTADKLSLSVMGLVPRIFVLEDGSQVSSPLQKRYTHFPGMGYDFQGWGMY